MNDLLLWCRVTIRVNGIKFGVFRLCGNDELDSIGNADD